MDAPSLRDMSQLEELISNPNVGKEKDLNNTFTRVEYIIQKWKKYMPIQALDNAISSLNQALGPDLETATDLDAERLAWLRDLAFARSTRYLYSGQNDDTTDCIRLLYRVKWVLKPPKSRFRPKSDNEPEVKPLPSPESALTLLKEFRQAANASTIDSILAELANLIPLYPPTQPNFCDLIIASAILTAWKYFIDDEIAHLDEATSKIQDAILLLPPTSFETTKFRWYVTLTHIAALRYEKTREFPDLQKALDYHDSADEQDEAARVSFGEGTSIFMGWMWNGLATPDLFNDAMRLLFKSLELRPAPHPLRLESLVHIASALVFRFQRDGSVGDLDKAIRLQREALALAPVPHPGRPHTLNNLSSALSIRAEQKGDTVDLDEAIVLQKEALVLRPAPDPSRASSLHNIAHSLKIRYDLKGSVGDLDESVRLLREAFDLLPEGNALHRSYALSNLANALRDVFLKKGVIADLEEAIGMHRKVLEQLPGSSNPTRYLALDYLANALLTRFNSTNSMADLEEATALLQQGLDSPALAPPHPGRSQLLLTLGTVTMAKFECTHEPAQFDTSISYFQRAAQYETGSLFLRLKAAQQWGHHAQTHQSATAALAGYACAIGLLPRIVSLDMSLQSRHSVLAQSADLASAATRCAVEARQLEDAVVFSATARSVFWSQALQLRTPVDELEVVRPDLAYKFRALSSRLEKSANGAQQQGLEDGSGPMPHMDAPVSSLTDQWQQCVDEIRKVDGFSDFLRPKSFAALRKAASRGPVILMNASSRGCDVLIIHRDTAVRHVPLENVTYERVVTMGNTIRRLVSAEDLPVDKLDELSRMLEVDIDAGESERKIKPSGRPRSQDAQAHLLRILEFLWRTIAHPVIRELKLEKSESPNRLWWCPTGPFVFLPIHAAGIYSGDRSAREGLFDYAISSYCSSLQDLLQPSSPAHDPNFKILAVIQPEVPNRRLNLPAAVHELAEIRKHLPLPASAPTSSLSSPHNPDHGDAHAEDQGHAQHQDYLIERVGRKDTGYTTPEQVLSDLPHVSIAHFACHGSQNLRNALDSFLVLSGGKLTMADIIQRTYGIQKKAAALAYLSACETAKGDPQQPDQAMHLAATMMFAGFRGVVGTMWAIQDVDAPIVADVFYGHLFGEKGEKIPPDVSEAAVALHLATKELRKRGRVFSHWVPFVHFGI